MTEEDPRIHSESPRIMSFSSAEAMFNYMDEEERKANEAILPKQREVTWGTYFWRYVEYVPCHVFAHVFSIEEIYLLEREHGADVNEAETTLRGKKQSHDRGYRYGMHYSTVEPDGELGDTHVTNVWPITKEDFEYARTHGWQPSLQMINRVYDEMVDEMGGDPSQF